MIARGINAAWRSYSIFVYYAWLNDIGAVSGQTGTNYDLDRSSPQSTKFCGNEGVYYLYLRDDDRLQWPYGSWKLQPDPYNINPVVSLLDYYPNITTPKEQISPLSSFKSLFPIHTSID